MKKKRYGKEEKEEEEEIEEKEKDSFFFVWTSNVVVDLSPTTLLKLYQLFITFFV